MKRLGLLAIAAVLVVVVTVPLVAQGDAAGGKSVYTREKCSACHNAKMNSLDHVGTKLTAEQIRRWIENPSEAAKAANSTSKMKMPKKNLTTADVDNLVAYLQTMK